jgi:uncharacterized repeat protein (TIGR03803 family)
LAANASASDSYDPSSGRLTIPTMTIGSATYSNVVVTIAGLVSGPTGTVPNQPRDSYDPASREITVPIVSVYNALFFNAVATVKDLVSIGSVDGADEFNAGILQIPAVLVGRTVYTDVLLAVNLGEVTGVAGGMPDTALDVYDLQQSMLTIPAVTANGHLYTNVTVSVGPGAVLSVGGIHDMTYTVGGSVSGLTAGSTVVLLNNGGDPITLSANAGFTFPIAIPFGTGYQVTVSPQPGGQKCAVSEGTGAAIQQNVTNIRVLCPTESALLTFPVISVVGLPAESGTGGGVILGSDGNFYGMTPSGGASGMGTVFRVTPTGVGTILWNFGANAGDGQQPHGGLVQGADGNFYGVTFYGGTNDSGGTVIRVTPAGEETVLWSFGAGSDGRTPIGNLVQGRDGNFYGTTASGGIYGYGTVFRITPSGMETVIWNFGATPADGQAPWGGVIEASDGALYGTTTQGGVNGLGTVYKVTGLNAETVLWSFGGPPDGQTPYDSLLQASDGNLYGTTLGGGADNGGVGFRITPLGAETVLWNFSASTGEAPVGGLIEGRDGALYGATTFQGLGQGSGTVFRATLGGELLVLWNNFAYDTGPMAGVIQGSDGALYGTTINGGGGVTPTPQGVIFRITF